MHKHKDVKIPLKYQIETVAPYYEKHETKVVKCKSH